TRQRPRLTGSHNRDLMSRQELRVDVMRFSEGGAYFPHWFQLLGVAREARENGVVQDAQPGTNRYFPQSLVVIVFAALAAEASINEVAEMAGRDVDSNDRGRGASVRPAEVQVLANLGRPSARSRMITERSSRSTSRRASCSRARPLTGAPSRTRVSML